MWADLGRVFSNPCSGDGVRPHLQRRAARAAALLLPGPNPAMQRLMFEEEPLKWRMHKIGQASSVN
jgi:hypothetical protein